MPLRNLFSLTILLFGSALVLAQAPVDTSDNQVWVEISISKKVAERAALTGFLATHVGDDVSRALEEQLGFGLLYSPKPFITFAPFYRWVPNQPKGGAHSSEQRGTLEITFHAPGLAHFLVSDHNSGEFRTINGRPSGRYYNFSQVEREVRLDRLRFTPYIGFQVFYDTRFGEWNRRRYLAGLKLPVRKNVTLEPYYFRQNDWRAVPGDWNVVSMLVHLDY